MGQMGLIISKIEFFCKGLWRGGGGNDGKMGLLEGTGRNEWILEGVSRGNGPKRPLPWPMPTFSVRAVFVGIPTAHRQGNVWRHFPWYLTWTRGKRFYFVSPEGILAQLLLFSHAPMLALLLLLKRQVQLFSLKISPCRLACETKNRNVTKKVNWISVEVGSLMMVLTSGVHDVSGTAG